MKKPDRKQYFSSSKNTFAVLVTFETFQFNILQLLTKASIFFVNSQYCNVYLNKIHLYSGNSQNGIQITYKFHRFKALTTFLEVHSEGKLSNHISPTFAWLYKRQYLHTYDTTRVQPSCPVTNSPLLIYYLCSLTDLTIASHCFPFLYFLCKVSRNARIIEIFIFVSLQSKRLHDSAIDLSEESREWRQKYLIFREVSIKN